MMSDLRNIKILFLVKTMDVGGAERFTLNLAKHFAPITAGVSVVSTGGIFVDELQKNGIKHIRLNNRPEIINFIPLCIELFRIIREDDYTIIHCQHRIFAFILQFMRKRKFFLFYTANNVFNDILQKTIFPDFAVAASLSIKFNLYHTTYLNKIKIKQINYGVELSNKKRSVNKIITIGFVGRLIKEKGIFNLLEAVSILASGNTDFRLIIRGKGEINKITEYIKLNKLTSIVTLAPASYDEEEIYKDIDLLLLPTILNEGLPISILEAAARGILVASTRAGGIEDFIEHEKTGLLLDSIEPIKLADSVKAIIENFDTYSVVIKNARLKVITEFSLDRMNDDYEKLYVKILSSSL